MKKKLQVLDITSIEVQGNVFNTTAINDKNDPYWVEFLQPFFDDIDVDIEVLPFDKIDKSKKWIINVDLQMHNWKNTDKNILELFSVNILKEMRSGNAYLILNHQCEGFTIDFFNLFYSKFKVMINTPYDRIIYMVAAADAESIYQKYVRDFNIKKSQQINIMYVHHVYKRFRYDFRKIFLNYDNNIKKEKKFISLNRQGHTHRLLLVSLLSEYDLLSHGYVSLGVMKNEYELAKNKLNKFFITLEQLDKFNITNEKKSKIMMGFSKIKDKLPLQIDPVDLKINQYSMDSLSPEFYRKSCFSIVSSTHALDIYEPSVNFTEKEIKPIIAKHPFIIHNRPGVLIHLKNMGFLTFEKWFDESYDTEVDDLKRLEMIIKEVDRLCKISFEEWEIMLDEMKPILDHNYNILLKYNYEHCFFNSDLKKMLYYVS